MLYRTARLKDTGVKGVPPGTDVWFFSEGRVKTTTLLEDDQSAVVAVGQVVSAQQLFASLDEYRPDCLVLDAEMPECGGLEAQAILQERGTSIPAVVITGRDDDTMRTRSLAAGACAYLYKPVDAEALLDAIRRAIGASS